MKLEFNRLPKIKAVGTRLTEDEYNVVEKLAKENKVSMGEAVHVLIRAALNEIEMGKLRRGE
jgi:hypothetical protein